METSEDAVPFSTKCMLVLVAILTAGVLVVYTTLVYSIGVESARVMALVEAREDAQAFVQREMREVCGPWFTDRRQAEVVICRRPSFMGGKP